MHKVTMNIAVGAFSIIALANPVLSQETKTLPMVTGEVTRVDESAGKLTIKHAAIPNLDMDAMTMVFKANDPAMLQAVKPNDKIKFTADKVNGQLTVMSVERGK